MSDEINNEVPLAAEVPTPEVPPVDAAAVVAQVPPVEAPTVETIPAAEASPDVAPVAKAAPAEVVAAVAVPVEAVVDHPATSFLAEIEHKLSLVGGLIEDDIRELVAKVRAAL